MSEKRNYHKGDPWTKEMRVQRDVCQAAVVNLITLPADHPAIEPSLELLRGLLAPFGPFGDTP